MAEIFLTIIGILLILGSVCTFMSLVVEKHETYDMIPEENLKPEKIIEILEEDFLIDDDLLDD
mgnify:FL=1